MMSKITRNLLILSLAASGTVGAVLGAVTLAGYVHVDPVGDTVKISRVVYLNTGGTSLWGQTANGQTPKFGCYIMGTNKVPRFANDAFMTRIGSSNYYQASVPAGYDTVIFVRMPPSFTSPTFEGRYNQTADWTIPSDKDCFTITAWLDGGEHKNSTGTWSAYMTQAVLESSESSSASA